MSHLRNIKITELHYEADGRIAPLLPWGPEAGGSSALRRVMPGDPLFIGNNKLQVRLAR